MQILSKTEDGDWTLVLEWTTAKRLEDVSPYLSIGTIYKLHEKKAPRGYDLADDIFFVVNEEGVLKLTDEDGNVLSDQTGLTVSTEIETIVVDEEMSYDIQYTLYTVTMVDKSGTHLPHTGGSGTLLYTLGGIALLAAALILGFYRRKRSEETR